MFQDFDELNDPSRGKERVAGLREWLAGKGLDGFVVPRADEHQGEYVPARSERLKWLTGFSGSAGVVMVYSASAIVAAERFHDPYFFLKKQLFWAVLGAIAMLVAVRVDYRRLERLVWPALVVATVLLATQGSGGQQRVVQAQAVLAAEAVAAGVAMAYGAIGTGPLLLLPALHAGLRFGGRGAVLAAVVGGLTGVGASLTVHGTGGQTRAFIHIQDSVRCIELALKNPPQRGSRVEIFNQMTETHRVRDLAEMIASLTGSEIAWLPNPRKEAAENELIVRNEKFRALGLDPITLQDGLLAEIVDVGKKYAYRVDRMRIPCVSAWTKEIAKIVERDPEHRGLKSA